MSQLVVQKADKSFYYHQLLHLWATVKTINELSQFLQYRLYYHIFQTIGLFFPLRILGAWQNICKDLCTWCIVYRNVLEKYISSVAEQNSNKSEQGKVNTSVKQKLFLRNSLHIKVRPIERCDSCTKTLKKSLKKNGPATRKSRK